MTEEFVMVTFHSDENRTQSLPPGLTLHQLLPLLPLVDLLRLATVSKAWRATCRLEVVWQNRLAALLQGKRDTDTHNKPEFCLAVAPAENKEDNDAIMMDGFADI